MAAFNFDKFGELGPWVKKEFWDFADKVRACNCCAEYIGEIGKEEDHKKFKEFMNNWVTCPYSHSLSVTHEETGRRFQFMLTWKHGV